ncbi:MAG: response regulator [Alphaproteobacteria bacterium]
MSKARLNLGKISAVLVDGDKYVQDLLGQMLRGFGLEHLATFDRGETAKDYITNNNVDLFIVEAVLPDMPGTDIVKYIRRLENAQTRMLPIIVLTGYTQVGAVERARDCGANLVIKKPVSPQVLFDRLAWVSKNQRPFIESENYMGPDRRFKSIGPPGGVGRRATDLSAEVGAATEPNMSQDEIDALLKPVRIAT